MIPGRFALMIWLLAGTPALALELNLPSNARETASVNTAPDAYRAPVGLFADGQLPGISVEGEVRRSAFRIGTPGLTPLQLMAPLRAQLIDSGYAIALDCAAPECGGFDFRFATETLTAPAMTVNLRNYRFLTAYQGSANAPDQVVTILASASPAAAHIQIIRAGALGDTPDQFTRQGGTLTANRPVARPDTPKPAAPTAETKDPVASLQSQGRLILRDLDFESGDVGAAPKPSDSLDALAAFLRDNPTRRIALVGHTDNTGPLDVNIAISLKRASAVRDRLIQDYGIDASRLEQHGVGFLAPVQSNATPEGREANRRVEAVVISE